ncbi:MAGUK p55 subfamily member 4-like [Nelusetta ayraudi]|uniref:MAGUK p55 subfamily member 4-like n=1 Tax=Nelusetta ayraudi TaxID=303726 RepID=UPI003F716A29
MREAMDNGLCVCVCAGLSAVLCSVVQDVSQAVDRNISGAQLLHELLSAPWLHALLQVYECLLQFQRAPPSPILPFASGLSAEVLTSIQEVTPHLSAEAQELYNLLRSPDLQALLWCHDSVAQVDYGPVLPEQQAWEGQQALRLVCLEKREEPLGATIRRDEETGGIFIARVIHGGLADRSGLLHPGDELVEVNGNPVEGLEPEQVIHILVQSHGTILFKVVPDSAHSSSSLKPVFMRAMVDYCPLLDASSPCPQAGVAFRRGDLLQVVDCSDPLWWQARKLPDITSCAGLIPSANRLKSKLREQWWSQPLQVHTCIRPLASDHEGEGPAAEDRVLQTGAEQCDITERTYPGKIHPHHSTAANHRVVPLSDSSLPPPPPAGEQRSSQLWRRRSCTSCPSCSVALGPVPYEEVELYQHPRQENHRLILLTGIPGVGVSNLRKRLLTLHPSMFQGPIPHTTRPIRGSEQPGREFYFVSRQQFEHMACSRRLVEHGEREGHLYGTSMDAILEVVQQGLTCVMEVEPHNIQLLRTSSLKPFVIFIRAPGPERTRATRKDEEHLAQLEEVSQRVEARYRHFFDRFLVHQESQETTEELTSIIQEAQEEAQWCPVSWRHSHHSGGA